MNALFRNYAKMYLFIYVICKLRVRHNYLSFSTVLAANYSTDCKGLIKSKKNNYPLLNNVKNIHLYLLKKTALIFCFILHMNIKSISQFGIGQVVNSY